MKLIKLLFILKKWIILSLFSPFFKLTKFLFTQKTWLIFSLFFFLLMLFTITPSPFKEINLTGWKNSLINDNKLAFSAKISESLTNLFSIPLLYKKYDLIFANTSNAKNDDNIIIMINKNSDFAPTAKKYFGKPFTDEGNLMQYKIEKGKKILIESLSENSIISYDTWLYSEDIGADCFENFGQKPPKDGCPTMDSTIIKFYAKQNPFDWIISTFALFLISIVFTSALRDVWENRIK